MPGPFPGMDPYLENRHDWPDTQRGMIAALRAILNYRLPPGYVASMDERICDLLPDGSEPEREIFLEVRPARGKRRTVTTIELLSFADKSPGNPWRDLYLAQQQRILHSSSHLIEIDLLRWGDHTVAAPEQSLQQHYSHGDYLICLHRSHQPGTFAFWIPTLRDSLPRIAVPLENGLPDIVLDIQAAFDRNYEDGAYAHCIDYTTAPSIPLEPDDARWSDSLLRERGFRS